MLLLIVLLELSTCYLPPIYLFQLCSNFVPKVKQFWNGSVLTLRKCHDYPFQKFHLFLLHSYIFIYIFIYLISYKKWNNWNSTSITLEPLGFKVFQNEYIFGTVLEQLAHLIFIHHIIYERPLRIVIIIVS